MATALGSIPRRAGCGCWRVGRAAVAGTCWIPSAGMWAVGLVGYMLQGQGTSPCELSTDAARQLTTAHMATSGFFSVGAILRNPKKA